MIRFPSFAAAWLIPARIAPKYSPPTKGANTPKVRTSCIATSRRWKHRPDSPDDSRGRTQAFRYTDALLIRRRRLASTTQPARCTRSTEPGNGTKQSRIDAYAPPRATLVARCQRLHMRNWPVIAGSSSRDARTAAPAHDHRAGVGGGDPSSTRSAPWNAAVSGDDDLDPMELLRL